MRLANNVAGSIDITRIFFHTASWYFMLLHDKWYYILFSAIQHDGIHIPEKEIFAVYRHSPFQLVPTVISRIRFDHDC